MAAAIQTNKESREGKKRPEDKDNNKEIDRLQGMTIGWRGEAPRAEADEQTFAFIYNRTYMDLQGGFKFHRVADHRRLTENFPNTLTTSKVAYFKRKYAEEEDLHKVYNGYFPKNLIFPEDRTCILRLSLEKLRILEDPEIYLRRAVLINNLLRKIHIETEKEVYDYAEQFNKVSKHLCSEAQKRMKYMIKDCNGCSQSLYYEEIGSYSIVPFSSNNVIYRLGYPSDHLGKSTS
ncbi:SERTA domain-containing protein 4-like [Scyliorhinus torazame]|uniref:SERTA domain-containing protein 4-like n=1 Tax=Scyliorhinus torazame TaxID=75743 RepID=UPI003B5B5A6D